ncbi:MAG: HlyD family type I secretion periplasmic adaptor subunit [Beijerinckiaceae bacterium]|jgi:HlyD family type I secretion membrane fusion protein|nr:HlyD family type I secretion periplasmic adaptor subunit [Beijerinckiaceae bacterium]
MSDAANHGFAYPRRTDVIARRSHAQLVWTIALGLTAFLVWAMVTTLDKVTRGSGRIVSQTRNQIIQHLEGGILSEVLVREGEVVRAGQPLVRIENSFARAELQQNQVDLKAKQIAWQRLDAEAKGLDEFTVSADLSRDSGHFAGQERSLFRARRDGLRAQLLVVEDQHRQKELELAEMRTRWTSSQREREIVLPRVESLRRLVRLGAVSQNELLDNERQLQQIEARLAGLIHDTARLEAAVSELNRRRDEIALRFRADAEKEQREIAVQIAKLEESIIAMRDRSNRTEVLAPVEGTVNKVFIDTIGGVIKSGEPILQIVPVDASLIVEARVSPSDRAEVWPGLKAIIKVSAYDFSIHGGLKGKVLDISPDALADEKGEPYFRVRLETDANGFGPGRPVIPGMLAQVDILSGQHTVLKYITRPVERIKNEALRQ